MDTIEADALKGLLKDANAEFLRGAVSGKPFMDGDGKMLVRMKPDTIRRLVKAEQELAKAEEATVAIRENPTAFCRWYPLPSGDVQAKMCGHRITITYGYITGEDQKGYFPEIDGRTVSRKPLATVEEAKRKALGVLYTQLRDDSAKVYFYMQGMEAGK